MIEPRNYCRQVTKQFTTTLSTVKSIPADVRTMLSHWVDLLAGAHKFLLPHEGIILGDGEYRAIDDSIEVELPFDVIALEFSRDQKSDMSDGLCIPSKSIVVARKRSPAFENGGNGFILSVANYVDHQGVWAVMPEVALPCQGFVRRDAMRGGFAGLLFSNSTGVFADDDYAYEVRVFVDFLNALACSNVHVEKLAAKKRTRRLKAALPFDTYHVLAVDVPGSVRSSTSGTGPERHPREHLRRGHIRRLADGRKIWVNATVVNAGRGGRIHKSYQLRSKDSVIATPGRKP